MDTYEKKYKEAQKWIESIYSELSHEQQMEAEAFFPELKESEDERISKEIIKYLERTVPHHHRDEVLKSKEWTAWLEKQGEQNSYTGVSFKYNGHTFGMCARDGGAEILMDGNLKAFVSLDKSFVYPVTPIPVFKAENFYVSKVDGQIHDMTYNHVNNVEPKFKVGDWITNSIETVQITGYDIDYGYQVDYKGNLQHRDTDIIEKKYHPWTIEDAKDGDVLNANGAPFIYKKHDKDSVYFYCGVNLADEFVEANGFDIWNNNNKVYPANKERRDTLFTKMKEAGYEWNAEKKELKKVDAELTDFEKSLKHIMIETLECGDTRNLKADAEMLLRFAQKPAEWSEEDGKNNS
jgi:hypothetical protein